MSDIATCAVCKGTGAHQHEETKHGDDGHVVMHSMFTTPCVCRLSAEPREGTARWWSSEERTIGAIDSPLLNASVDITVEIPFDAENHRVVMRGNRYYPAMVMLDIDVIGRTMLTEDARELARLLIEAADQCDAIDDADAGTCGHWAPCDCEASA